MPELSSAEKGKYGMDGAPSQHEVGHKIRNTESAKDKINRWKIEDQTAAIDSAIRTACNAFTVNEYRTSRNSFAVIP